MFGLLLALLTALLESAKDVLSKRQLEVFDEYLVAWALFFFSFLLLLPPLAFSGVPALDRTYLAALLGNGVLNTISNLLYMRAIKRSDLSLSIPMITFTPLFLFITSPLIVGEYPTRLGGIGVLLIVCGSYLLHFKERRYGLLGPFKSLYREEGPRLMLIVAFLWSISSTLDKVGVVHSSPIFWGVSVSGFLSLSLLPFVVFRSHFSGIDVPRLLKRLLPLGICGAGIFFLQMTALQFTLVAYVIAVKRTSALLSVVWGHFIFRETGFRERIGGAALMCLGVAVIMTSV